MSDTRRKIAQALLGQREEQFQAASRRQGPTRKPQDARQPGEWQVRGRPQGNLRRGLTGFSIKAEKRF